MGQPMPMPAPEIMRTLSARQRAQFEAARQRAAMGEAQGAQDRAVRLHRAWWERQKMAVRAILEILPFPSVAPGSPEHREHIVKALILAAAETAGEWGVGWEDFVRHSESLYRLAERRRQVGDEIEAAQAQARAGVEGAPAGQRATPDGPPEQTDTREAS